MAKEHTEDRIFEYLRERGDAGAAPEEIAAEFMNAANVPPAIAARIIAPLLNNDSRFHQGEDGCWRAGEAPPPKVQLYTVAEFLFAPGASTEHVPIECGVAKLSDQKSEGGLSTLMKPEFPVAPETRLPDGIRQEELLRAPDTVRVLERLHAAANGATLASYQRTPLHAKVCHADPTRPIHYLSVKKLARRMGVIPRAATLRDCAEALNVVLPQPSRAADRAAATAEILRLLLAQLQEQEDIKNVSEIEDFLAPQYIEVDFANYDFDTTYLETLPDGPGCYIMQDANGTPVYVGKAANLRRRVGSYFKRKVQESERDKRIRERVVGIAIERAGSELEAILLEQRRIRELTPELNQQREVHDREERIPRDPNLILVLPSQDPACAELFLVMDGDRLAQLRVQVDKPEDAEQTLNSAYYSDAPPPASGSAEDVELLWSWLAKNRDKVNIINVDSGGGLKNVMRMLADHLSHDDPAEGRTYRV